MGVHDRDWYQEHWCRNVLGIDPRDEKRAARRVRRRRAVAPDVARFWRAVSWLFIFAATLVFWSLVLR